jgi:hypothetical protein
MSDASAFGKTSLLMTVSLRLAPQDEAAFNDFYHHQYIPRLWENTSVFHSVRRFEEFGVAGSLRWFNKEYLTIYELKNGICPADVEAALEAPGREAEVLLWQQWKSSALKDCRREFFEEIYRHPREPFGGCFASRPFFRVSVQTKPTETVAIESWYHHEYLPKIMADVPTWAACRRYRSLDQNSTTAHTIYETENTDALQESFSLMRAPHRYQSNAQWDDWVEKAIFQQDATSFRPIFRFPD